LWTVFAAVGLLLLIGCGNLANLLLVRAGRAPAGTRASHVARASSASIVRQLAIEGRDTRDTGRRRRRRALPPEPSRCGARSGPVNFPRMAEVALSGRVIGFAALATCAATLVAGVMPAWLASQDLQAALGGDTRSLTGNRRQGRARRGFLVVQVAGSAILLVCMSLVARGFQRLEQVDPGFTADHALSVQLSLPPARYREP
jgi:hypothetical protein